MKSFLHYSGWTHDIYQSLDPVFIEDRRSYKLWLKNDKGKGIAVAEGDQVDEDKFQYDLQEAIRISWFETTLPQGKPSKANDEEVVEEEEELVEYDPSLNPTVTLTHIIPNHVVVEDLDYEDNDDEVLDALSTSINETVFEVEEERPSLVLGFKAASGVVETWKH